MMESPVQCGRNAHAAPGLFSLAGTAVKASGTDAQPDAAGSVLWGLLRVTLDIEKEVPYGFHDD